MRREEGPTEKPVVRGGKEAWRGKIQFTIQELFGVQEQGGGE